MAFSVHGGSRCRCWTSRMHRSIEAFDLLPAPWQCKIQISLKDLMTLSPSSCHSPTSFAIRHVAHQRLILICKLASGHGKLSNGSGAAIWGKVYPFLHRHQIYTFLHRHQIQLLGDLLCHHWCLSSFLRYCNGWMVCLSIFSELNNEVQLLHQSELIVLIVNCWLTGSSADSWVWTPFFNAWVYPCRSASSAAVSVVLLDGGFCLHWSSPKASCGLFSAEATKTEMHGSFSHLITMLQCSFVAQAPGHRIDRLLLSLWADIFCFPGSMAFSMHVIP